MKKVIVGRVYKGWQDIFGKKRKSLNGVTEYYLMPDIFSLKNNGTQVRITIEEINPTNRG